MAKKKVPSRGTSWATLDREAVFVTLKRVLRARKITYADLARRLGLSESGIKKIFAHGDCSLSRLEQIARVAEVPLGELFETAQAAPFEHVALTDEQQRALLRDPRLLAVFWKLSVEKHSTKRVAKDLRLDGRATMRALHELDRLELIRLEQPGDRVRLRHGDLVRWLPHGPLLDHLHDVWGRDVLARATKQGFLSLQQLWLRPEARTQLEADVVALLEGYVRRGRADWLTGGERAAFPHGVLVAMAAGSFVRG